tara:strand:- start:19 stop:228 length:210 start_codon:yes stop_codon:yes gene_type:complete
VVLLVEEQRQMVRLVLQLQIKEPLVVMELVVMLETLLEVVAEVLVLLDRMVMVIVQEKLELVVLDFLII